MERDDGLRAALAAAGGEAPLARAIGIKVPSLRDWRRVPAHRIVQVEAVTGVRRELLRPDLFAPGTTIQYAENKSGMSAILDTSVLIDAFARRQAQRLPPPVAKRVVALKAEIKKTLRDTTKTALLFSPPQAGKSENPALMAPLLVLKLACLLDDREPSFFIVVLLKVRHTLAGILAEEQPKPALAKRLDGLKAEIEQALGWLSDGEPERPRLQKRRSISKV